MDEITPQLAKLIVLKWALAVAKKWDRLENEERITEQDKKVLNDAINNYILNLESNIIYQEKLCK